MLGFESRRGGALVGAVFPFFVSPFSNITSLSRVTVILLISFFISPTNSLAGSDLHLCDQIGAIPMDDYRVGIPVSRENYNAHEVEKACREALVNEPDNPRYHFQLGMALLGLGGEGAIQHLQIAADKEYVAAYAALFILAQKLKKNGE